MIKRTMIETDKEIQCNYNKPKLKGLWLKQLKSNYRKQSSKELWLKQIKT